MQMRDRGGLRWLLPLGLAACGTEVSDSVTASFSGTGTGGSSTTTGPDTDSGDAGTTGSTSSAGSTGGGSTGGSSGSTTGDGTTTGVRPGCGDGVLGAGEQCDDGNQNNNDGCSNDCANPGVGLWQVIRDNGGSEDFAYSIAVDGAGEVLITGTEEPALAEVNDILIAKYRGVDGSPLWNKTKDGGQLLDDFSWAITTDADDNVFVTGGVLVAGNGLDLWLAKYNYNAQIFWEKVHGPTTSTEEGRGIAADADGNVIVVGGEVGQVGGRNIWIRKYDADGNEVWTVTYDGQAGTEDVATDVVVADDGHIIVTGWETTATQDEDVWIGKYDGDGNEVWTTTWNGPLNWQDVANGVGVGADGSIVVTGSTEWFQNAGNNPVTDLWVGSFDADGLLVWEDQVDGAIKGSDHGESVVVDSLGNAIVVGSVAIDEYVPGSVFNGQPLIRELWVRKYDPTGQEIWTHSFGPNNETAWAYDVALDDIDNIFVTGTVRTGMDADIVIRKISP